MTNLTEADYKVAQAGDAKIRQEFLDELDLEDAREYIRRIEYDYKGKQISDSFAKRNEVTVNDIYAMSIHPATPVSWFTKKSVVAVYPRLFNRSLSRFKSTVIDHEGYHCAQHIERGEDIVQEFIKDPFIFTDAKMVSDYMRSLRECLAYSSQLQKHVERGLTEDEEMEIRENIFDQVLFVVDLFHGRDIIRDLEFMLCKAPRDITSREVLFPFMRDMLERYGD